MKARIAGHLIEVAEAQVRGLEPSHRVAGERLATQRHASVPTAPYRSKLEAAYANQLDAMQRAGDIKAWWYEPFSFQLSTGKRFRVDFLVQYPDGLEKPLECIEVKGAWIKNRRDSITRLHWAAQRFPCFVWRLVWREGHGFNGQYITA